jgi:peptidoglycan/LPS O-acetylase OafA/YrhL
VQRRIPSLDGLRAISILMVLYGHAVGTDGFPVRYRSLGLAEAGVRVFFIISGFLITKLLLTELDASGRISLKAFYRRRILRIFPAFYIYWLVMLLLTVGGLLTIAWKDFAYAATYTINYVMNRPWYLGHLWSLAVEEQFYALWPLTLVLLGRRRGFWVAGSVLLIVPLLRVAQLHLIPSHQQGITEEFHTIADCIATGCLLAGLAGWAWSHERYRRFLGSRQFWLAPCTIALALVLGTHPQVKWLIGIPMFNLAIALCIDRWTRFSNADIVGKFLNWRPLAFIGVLSYSLYLWQQPFFDHRGHHLWNAFPFNVTGALLMALASYYLVEKPFLALRYGPARRMPVVEGSQALSAGESSSEAGPGVAASGEKVI